MTTKDDIYFLKQEVARLHRHLEILYRTDSNIREELQKERCRITDVANEFNSFRKRTIEGKW